MVENVDAFANHLVLLERKDGMRDLRIFDLRQPLQFTGNETLVKYPETVYNVTPAGNKTFDTATLRYVYDSPITPTSTFEYDMDKHTSTLIKQREVPGGFDRNNYALERVWAPAKDGVKVPVTVFYRKNTKRDGTAPMYLYAYGSYGYPLPVNFSSNRLALLDRGFVVALAHIRGGGDLGKTWHDAGRMMNKMNTFTDFIASAEYLIAQKYCDPKKIAIEGGSAGGLLMGAVTNLRPDLWGAVISKVPFVDVMNTMLDASLPLTVGEYEEWGNPNKKDEYTYMKQYSPYDNLAAKTYPPLLVKTSFNDSQVMYWEPAKYTAKLRSLKPKSDHNVLMLKTNMAGGHGGSSGRYDALHDTAFDYAFILDQLGVAKQGSEATK
jgi:oligopeptidase B